MNRLGSCFCSRVCPVPRGRQGCGLPQIHTPALGLCLPHLLRLPESPESQVPAGWRGQAPLARGWASPSRNEALGRLRGQGGLLAVDGRHPGDTAGRVVTSARAWRPRAWCPQGAREPEQTTQLSGTRSPLCDPGCHHLSRRGGQVINPVLSSMACNRTVVAPVCASDPLGRHDAPPWEERAISR